MGTPQTWAEIAERLGIPFAIVLLLFFFLALVCAWLGRNVIKPVTKAHVDFVKHTGETQKTLVDLNQRQIDHDKEHDRRTMDRLDKIADALERGCPLLNEQRKNGGQK